MTTRHADEGGDALTDTAQASLDDPIVAEVRAIREAQFASVGYDLDAYVRWMQAEEARSTHPLIHGAARPPVDREAVPPSQEEPDT